MKMTAEQVALFERGFAAYADGIARERVAGNKADLVWLLRGWDAGKATNESIREQLDYWSQSPIVR